MAVVKEETAEGHDGGDKAVNAFGGFALRRLDVVRNAGLDGDVADHPAGDGVADALDRTPNAYSVLRNSEGSASRDAPTHIRPRIVSITALGARWSR